MEKFVLVMVITLGAGNETHAKGPFSTQRGCWRWTAMFNSIPQPEWIGRCMPMSEFRREFPRLTLDEDS